MSGKRFAIPEGMLEAAAEKADVSGLLAIDRLEVILEAAVRWLAENPVVPTESQGRELDDAWLRNKTSPESTFSHATTFGAVEWQRRMFLAPEPEVPEEVRDLIVDVTMKRLKGTELLNTEVARGYIIEAYRRGQKSAGE